MSLFIYSLQSTMVLKCVMIFFMVWWRQVVSVLSCNRPFRLPNLSVMHLCPELPCFLAPIIHNQTYIIYRSVSFKAFSWLCVKKKLSETLL